MNQEEQEKAGKQKSEGEQTKQSVDQYPADLLEAIRQATFRTLAVTCVRGFTDLKIIATRKIAEDVYAVSFSYYVLNITGPTFTEGQGLYVHQFAPALYLDAYAISNFANDLFNPPPSSA
ncbi:MAG TPA: hypothetical protein VFA09_04360 [Ktedonobacteraceae bacterium]|nr:hypothetical protein [Ktedonobacteraceae bacterium]